MTMGFADIFRRKEEEPESVATGGERKDSDIFKAYIPDFLYRPPFGMPRKVNTPQLKLMSANPYVFSVIKTLCDEATSIGWEIKVKEEFQEDIDSDEDEPEVEEKAEPSTYDEQIKEVTKFFRNPNGNNESFNHLLRQLITDLCEVDSAVLVKVFNLEGKMTQIFSRDGSLFLKNPDIYGYIGNKTDFVAPLPDGFTGTNMNVGGTPTETQQQIMKQYTLLYRDAAAYFQYGWTAGSMPIPFGKREVVYMMQNPRADSIYGTSPISRLMNTILNLIYGIDFNLDFYTNNNMPEGAIELLGANKAQITQWRENFENRFKFTDELGNKRKKFFKFPISSTPVNFKQFQLSAKEMDIIAQQEWFTKILWMSFGVNADEMGFTENSNKSVGEEQISTFKRKAVRPLLDVIQYHINTQLIPEFFASEKELPDYSDVPLEFCFDTYDLDEDLKELNKFKTEIDMGIKTAKMVAKERGVDLEELQEGLDEAKQEEIEKFDRENSFNDFNNFSEKSKPKKNVEKKSNPLNEIETHIDNIGEDIVKEVEKLGNGQFE